MAVARTSAGTMVSSAAALTATFGAGAAAGNFALLAVETANEAVTTPSGWSIILSQNGVGTAATIGATRLSLFYKDNITAGDISGGIAVADSGDHQNAALWTYSGVDTTRFAIGNSSTQTPASTAYSTGGLGAEFLSSGDIALAVCATDRDSGTVSTNASAAWANTTGSNSFPINGSSATGLGGGLIVNELVATAPASGTFSFSCTITSSIWHGFNLVLRAFVSPPFRNLNPMLPLLVR